MMKGIHRCHMESSREGIIGRLSHIDIIIRMDAESASCLFKLTISNMSNHFIHIHVTLGAGSGLINHQREFTLPLSCQNFVAGAADGFSFFCSKSPSFLIYFGSAFF